MLGVIDYDYSDSALLLTASSNRFKGLNLGAVDRTVKIPLKLGKNKIRLEANNGCVQKVRKVTVDRISRHQHKNKLFKLDEYPRVTLSSKGSINLSGTLNLPDNPFDLRVSAYGVKAHRVKEIGQNKFYFEILDIPLRDRGKSYLSVCKRNTMMRTMLSMVALHSTKRK